MVLSAAITAVGLPVADVPVVADVVVDAVDVVVVAAVVDAVDVIVLGYFIILWLLAKAAGRGILWC